MTNGTQTPGAPQKKGLPVLAWVGIGCGVILLIIVIVLVAGGMFVAHKMKEVGIDPELWEEQPALAASKVIATFNPDLEVVEVDEDGGTITVRNTKNGEVITVNLDDVRSGNISFRDESTGKEVKIRAETSGEGEEGTFTVTDGSGTEVMTVGEGASTDVPSWVPIYPGTTPTGRFSMSTDEGTTLALGLETGDPVDQVLEFYKKKLEAEGFKTSVTTFSSDEGKGGFITATDDSKGRTLQVSINREDGTTSVGLNCTETAKK